MLILIILFFIIEIVLTYIFKFLGYKCLFRQMFKVYCAGCGTTRMLEEMIKLEFYKAFRYNPFMFIITVLGFVYILFGIFKYIKTKKIIKFKYEYLIIILVLSFLFMILRNIPLFEYLKTTKV